MDTPLITTADCEGAGESFYLQPSNKSVYHCSTLENNGILLRSNENNDDIDEQDINSMENSEDAKREFFGRPTFLTVSSQMHLEACTCAFKQVYCFNPAFRAESSLSRQHLAEFYMLEAEIAFLQELEPLMEIVEKLYLSTVHFLLAENAEDINRCLGYRPENHLAELGNILKLSNFPRIPYSEAVKILQSASTTEDFVRPAQDGQDLNKEHEHYLVKHFGNVPIFVTHYPADLKPFYMKRTSNNQQALCFDLLAPHAGEICGGSLREDNFLFLNDRLKTLKLETRLKWYVDLRRIGYAKTGGFGFGFDRFLQSVLGLKNIKDTLLFPRWYKHCHL